MNSDRQNKIFSVLSLFSFGLFIILRDSDLIIQRSFSEKAINLVFELIFFIPIILLPIRWVENKVISSIEQDKGLRIGLSLVFISTLYYSLLCFLNFSDKEKRDKTENILFCRSEFIRPLAHE
jgi:hypothetical protein